MARHLVLGGAGFIGSHLCEALIGQDDQVWALDSLFTGREKNLTEGVKFVFGDVTSPGMDETIPREMPRCDYVWNLACPASPIHYQLNPVFTTRTCLLGTMLMLDLCRKWMATGIQASTSEVYGDPVPRMQKEDYWGNVNCWGPRSCYDEGKRAAETLCRDYAIQYNTAVRVARIFNTYGPRMRADDGRVVSNFICQALRGVPSTIYGSGVQTRSFCYVDDLVRGLIMLSRSGYGAPVNLGNPKEFTMLMLAEEISEACGTHLMTEHKPLPLDDPRQRCPDITLARTMGWEPEVQLREGIQKTVGYFRGQLLGSHP